MRVLILNSARKFIGEAAHCLDLARELLARGYEARLLLRRGYEVAQRAEAEGLPAQVLNFSSDFAPWADWQDLRQLKALVRTWQPDIIHCHRGKDHWLAAAARLASGGRFPPLVRTRHVTVPMAQHAANRWLMLGATARTIAVSRAAAASLGEIGRLLGDRLHIVYSAVDLARFSPAKRSEEFRRQLGINPGELLIGLIGRIQNIKGQRIFLEAARAIAQAFPATKFLIAGRGADYRFEALLRTAHELGIGDRVVLRGWLADVSVAIASLDVSVIASLGSEGSSRIGYESMASGVPLVATRVGCLPEIVRERETGLLVPPADARALAGALAELLAYPEEARTYARNALQRVRTFHNYDRWIAETVSVYEQALAYPRRCEA